MLDIESDGSIALIASVELAMHSGDRAAVGEYRSAIDQRKKELDSEYLMLSQTAGRIANFLVTGDPSQIPRPEFEA